MSVATGGVHTRLYEFAPGLRLRVTGDRAVARYFDGEYGSARAEGWQHFPIVRMVNVSLDPGSFTYQELLRGVDRGLLLDAPASYSLDDKRQNFHFSTQSARVIRGGEIEGYVRGVSFQSLTPDFWGRCDAVADDWELHGFLSCAKGEPLQFMRVGHGAAHARFRDVPIEVRE